MSLLHLSKLLERFRFPRVSGDEPELPAADLTRWEFSPRERG